MFILSPTNIVVLVPGFLIIVMFETPSCVFEYNTHFLNPQILGDIINNFMGLGDSWVVKLDPICITSIMIRPVHLGVKLMRTVPVRVNTSR